MLLLGLMQINDRNIKKYVTTYVYMYNFSRFCYIVTDNALSDSSITQDEQTYYCVFGEVYACTKYIGMIADSVK